MKPQGIQLPRLQYDFMPLFGVMDQVNPALSIKPGVARHSLNFECSLNGNGFQRIVGYERFDGQTSPSSQAFVIVPIILYTNTPTVGQTLTGVTTGTTARIIAIGTTHLVVTMMSAPGFSDAEDLVVGATPISTTRSQSHVTLTRSQKQQYRALAAEEYRALIDAVPGQGPIRGVFGATFQGVFHVYAFRDYDGGSAGVRGRLYRDSNAGWVQVPFNLQVRFHLGGPVPPDENTFIIDGVGTPYKIKRVVLQTGTWAGNDAAGWLIIEHPDGGDQGAGALLNTTVTVGASTFTTIGFAARVTQQPEGRYEFVQENFSGQLATTRVYGCDGANRCFEFDGETFVPISTTLEVPSIDVGFSEYRVYQDRPVHIAAHLNHLFVAIGSSIINSETGFPYRWGATGGAVETAAGDDVTALQPLPGSQQTGALGVFLRNHTKILYGFNSTSSPFQLVNYEINTGAIPGTIQQLDKLYYLDDRGIISLNSTLSFGNFVTATITRPMQPWIDWKRGRAVCSLLNRSKSQYRLFFNDGMGLFMTFDQGKVKGSLPVSMPHTFTCAWSGEDQNGQEVSFVGGNDGFVYQLERGTSCDGTALEFELLTNENTMKAPRVLKTVHKCAVELQEGDYAEFEFGVKFGPELTNHLQDALATSLTTEELAMRWDDFTWDDFYWEGHELSPVELEVKGTAERMRYAIRGSSTYLDSFTLTGITTHYFTRRGLR